MKKVYFLILLLLPLLSFPQWRIEGTITDASTKLGLPGAHIRLLPNNWATVSGLDGSFKLSNLKEGVYSLEISYIGFETKTKQVSISADAQLQLNLEPESFMTNEVIVRAARATPNSPITYSLVTRSDIEQNNTGADLPYLLQSTPSVVLTSDAGAGIGYTGIRIRGTDITRINVTMNGVPVNDPESHGVFFVNMPDLVSSVDNMQIQRGVGTSANGSAAFGASINIKTDAWEPDPYARYQSMFGSFNTFRNTLLFGTGISQNGFSLNGRLSKISSDGYIERGWSDLRSFYISGGWQSSSSLLRFVVTSGKETTYQSWNGVPKDSLATNRRYNPSGRMLDKNGDFIGYYANQTDNYQQDYYQLHLAHRFNKKMFATTTLFLTNGNGYYESWRNNRRLRNYGLADVVIGGETISRTNLIDRKWLDNAFYGFNSAFHLTHNQYNIVFGGGWNHYNGDHFGTIIWAEFPSTSTPGNNYYFNNGKKTDYHVFARFERSINNKLYMYADLQQRGISYTIAGTHDNLRDISQSHSYSFFNPKAGLNYALNATNKLYLSVAASNREPNRSVFRDADEGQDIKHEQLIDYELGHRFSGQRIQLETNVFYMDYKNQLVLTGRINNVGAPILINVPESYRAGIEMAANVNPGRMLSWTGNLSLSTNKIKNFTEFVDNWNYWDDPENQPNQYSFELGRSDISFSPSVVAGSRFELRPAAHTSIQLQSNYVSRQYLDNTSDIERSLNPYLINNLAFHYDFEVKKLGKLGFSLHLNNILNTMYETNGWVYRYIFDGESYLMDGYFPQAGFHWYAGLRLEF